MALGKFPACLCWLDTSLACNPVRKVEAEGDNSWTGLASFGDQARAKVRARDVRLTFV